MFLYFQGNKVRGCVSTHVDNFWWAGSVEFGKHISERLQSIFHIKSTAFLPFRYLGLDIAGLDIARLDQYLTIDQVHYAKDVSEIEGSSIGLGNDNRSHMRRALGKLQRLANQPAAVFDQLSVRENLHRRFE